MRRRDYPRQAQMAKELLEAGCSLAEVASAFGVSRVEAYRLSKLATLPEFWQYIERRLLPPSAAWHLAMVDPDTRRSILDRLKAGKRVTVKDLEAARFSRQHPPATETTDGTQHYYTLLLTREQVDELLQDISPSPSSVMAQRLRMDMVRWLQTKAREVNP